MTSSPLHSLARRRSLSGFTLIELLAVMAIILVLAGLIINIAGSAQYNSAKARATTEVSAISTALESYKADNGDYPTDPYTPSTSAPPTGLLNAQKNFDPTSTLYTNNSEYLFQVLSGYPVTVGTTPSTATAATKSYYKFSSQQLKADSTNTGTSPNPTRYYIIDPFGYSYGYSTIYKAYSNYQSAQPAAAGGTGQQNTTYGYNPTFDLWSTAGYAPGGKSTPATSNAGANDATVYSSLWIKNW